MVPLLTPGQEVAVLVALPVMPEPVVTVTVRVPVQPFASVMETVWVPAETPVNKLLSWEGPPSSEYE